MAASDNEENYWPGYVDALTTMTMVLTFIMLVLGLAVFSLSQNVSKGMLESIANAMKLSDELPKDLSTDEIAERVMARVVERDEEIRLAKAEVEKLLVARAEPQRDAPGEEGASDKERRIESAAAAPSPAAGGAALAARQTGQIRLVYKPRATGLDDESRQAVGQALADDGALRSAEKIDVVAGVDPKSLAVSDANRTAYYRALILRGQLLTAGVAPDRIRLRIDAAVASDQVIIAAAR
jgi:hypothetical protein